MVDRIRRGVGAVLVVAGASLWAVSVAFSMTDARVAELLAFDDPNSPSGLSPGDLFVLTVYDLRWAAIALALVGVMLGAAPRTWRAAMPALWGAGGLLVADAVFGRLGDPGRSRELEVAIDRGTELQVAPFAGPSAAAVAFAVAVAVAASTWAAIAVVGRRSQRAYLPPQRSAPLVTAAVAAAMAAPFAGAGASQDAAYVESVLPATLLVASEMASAVLAVAAIACALAANRGRRGLVPGGVFLAMGIAVPIAVTGALWPGSSNDVWQMAGLGPLIVGTSSLAWSDCTLMPWLRWLQRVGSARWLLAVASAVVLYVPLSIGLLFLWPVAALLLETSGGTLGADGFPGMFSAAVLGGVLLGARLEFMANANGGEAARGARNADPGSLPRPVSSYAAGRR